ncbi:MAG: hydrogenase maturation nickel metallochaperone HypA [Solirubrobacteraceae bacterium]|jgi:hydrogenase nickel incorporation protein HypA/HybF
MHELSVASAIVETATRHADGRPVAVVSVRIGALRQVVPDSLQFYFGIVARDGVCEHAKLELTDVPLRLRCGECGEEWEPEYPDFRCVRCAPGSVEALAGQELEVEYIEVEEEAACIGPR